MDLKEFRKKYKLTQQRFADMLGISRSTYRDIEMGKAAPSASLLNSLRKVQEEIEKEQFEVYYEEITIKKFNKNGKVIAEQVIKKNKEMLEEEKALEELERIIG